MNQFTLLVVVVVVFCYFGGKYCPSALKKNKELLLGVAGGLVLCSFFGLRLEGVTAFGGGSAEQLRSTLSHHREEGGGDLLRGSNVARAAAGASHTGRGVRNLRCQMYPDSEGCQ